MKHTKEDENFMREAIRLSRESVKNGGGPFGAVIVKDGKIVAGSANSVTQDNDPTAHAEVNTIRLACKNLKTFDLSGCTIYTSCEPCPMCLGAVYWASISKMFFGNDKIDAQNIDFSDAFIYREIELPYEKRNIPTQQICRDEAILAFQDWEANTEKVEY